MAYPAQTKSGKIVNIVDKAVIGGGSLIEVFTDEDGKKYTRDLVTNHAPHILYPIEDSLDLAENMVAAGVEGAEAILDNIEEVAQAVGIGVNPEPAESLIEKVGDAIESGIDAAKEVVEEVEDALGIQNDLPADAAQVTPDPNTPNPASDGEEATAAAE